MHAQDTSGVLLNDQAMEYLRGGGEELVYEPGAVIHRDASDSYFYVVLSGVAEVQLLSDEGLAMPIGKLPAGSTFGITNILQRKPSSGAVVALTQVRVLRYPGERLETALRESEDVRSYVISKMAHTLQETRQEAWNFFRRSHAFDMLFSASRKTGPLIANSPAMRRIQARLPELAGDQRPVLLVGEPGTGKTFLAGKIHEALGQPAAPFTIFGCGETADEGEENKILFGSSRFAESSAQSSGYGALHLADDGILVLRNIEKLNLRSQKLLAKYLAHQQATGPNIFPQTKVIATTSANLVQLGHQKRFHPELAAILCANTIDIPKLSARKRDIPALARQFLEERGDGKTLTREATALLFSLKYRDRNVAELRDAIQLAALFTKGKEISAEHIRTGPEDENHSMEIDLSRFHTVRRLLKQPFRASVRAAVYVSFVVVIALGFVAGDSWLRLVSSGLVWALWEPLLILALLGTGRLWCAVCPLCLTGDKLQQAGYGLNRPVPAWIKKNTAWITTLGFFAIVLAESLLLMSHKPAFTSLLLLTLVALAVAISLIYRKQAWCRYFCPLGAMAGAYSASSSLRVKANISVCTNHCTTHDCYNGSTRGRGCPVSHHPVHAGDADECKMCLECLETCPHGSTKLYFRPTLQGIWNMGVLGSNMRLFTACLFTFSIVMMSASGYAWSTTATGMLSAAGAALVAGLGFNRFIDWMFSEEAVRDPSVAARIGYAFAVLAWGPLMAHQFQNMPLFTELYVQGVPGGALRELLPPVTLAGILEALVIIVAMVFWVFTLGFIRQRLRRMGSNAKFFRRWLPLYLVGAAYTLASLVIALTRAGA